MRKSSNCLPKSLWRIKVDECVDRVLSEHKYLSRRDARDICAHVLPKPCSEEVNPSGQVEGD